MSFSHLHYKVIPRERQAVLVYSQFNTVFLKYLSYKKREEEATWHFEKIQTDAILHLFVK